MLRWWMIWVLMMLDVEGRALVIPSFFAWIDFLVPCQEWETSIAVLVVEHIQNYNIEKRKI